jgi:hypothetical protein
MIYICQDRILPLHHFGRLNRFDREPKLIPLQIRIGLLFRLIRNEIHSVLEQQHHIR